MRKTPEPSIKNIKLFPGQVIRGFTLISFIPSQNNSKAAWFVEDESKSLHILGDCSLKYKSIRSPKRDEASALFRRLYTICRQSAKKRELKFELTEKQIAELVVQPCTYCNTKDSNVCKQGKVELKYNGIDRVDSNLGYVLENCVPCCYICNYAKNDSTQKEFYTWIDNLVKYRNEVTGWRAQ